MQARWQDGERSFLAKHSANPLKYFAPGSFLAEEKADNDSRYDQKRCRDTFHLGLSMGR